MALLRTVTFTITCDGAEDCWNAAYGVDRADAVTSATEGGWVFARGRTGTDGRKGPLRYYCPDHAHLILKACSKCERLMRPWRRPPEDFPIETVAQGAGGLCNGCYVRHLRGSTGAGRTTGMGNGGGADVRRAAEQYVRYRPAEFADFIETTELEAMVMLARACLERTGADDLLEVLGIG